MFLSVLVPLKTFREKEERKKTFREKLLHTWTQLFWGSDPHPMSKDRKHLR